MIENIYSLPGFIYFISLVGMFILTSYVYFMGIDSGLKLSALISFSSTTFMSLFAILRIASPSHWEIFTTLFLISVYYAGFGWFYFISEFIEYDIDKRIIYTLFGVYTVLSVVTVTRTIHHAFASYNPIYFDNVISIVVLSDVGFFFLLLVIISYPMFMIGIGLLVRELFYTENKLRQKQLFVVIVGSIVPITGDFLSTAGVTIPFEPILVSLAFVTAPSYMYAILSYNFIEKKPLTREKIVKHLDEGVFTLSPDLNILDVNIKGLNMFNFNSIRSAKFSKFPEELQREIERFTENNQETTSKEFNFNLDGDKKWFKVTFIRIPLPEDQCQLAMTISDITKERRQREKLITKNKQLDQFSRVVSHDMTNHLNVGESYLELVKNELDDYVDEQTIDWIEYIEDSFANIKSIVNDASMITTVIDENKDEVDFGELASEVVEQIDSGDVIIQNNINVKQEADENSMNRLFENFIQNSLKHGGDGLSKIVLGELDDKKGIFIEDDGKGIEDTEKIFESGYTTSENGSGLGLSIIQTVIELHEWEIHVSESSSGGARFEIVF